MRRCRWWLITVTLACLAPMPGGARLEDPSDQPHRAANQRILRGLGGVRVVVEDLPPEAGEAGVTKQGLQADVEARLRKAGIRLLTDAPRSPYLLLVVAVTKASVSGFYGWAVDLELKELVRLERDPERSTWAVTWGYPAYRFGAASKARLKGRVRQVVAEMVDAFRDDYLAANP